MTRNGKIQKNGVLVLDDGTKLPDGATVRVELIEEPLADDGDNGELSPLFTIGRRAVHTGIPDLAANHDHYLYGHPKVTDEQP